MVSKEVCQSLSWLLEQVAAGVALVIRLQPCSKLCCLSTVAAAELQSQQFLSGLATDMWWPVTILGLGLLQQSARIFHSL